MIRPALISLLCLFATPLLAASPSADGHNQDHATSIKADPSYIFSEAPTDHVLGSADADHTLIMYASNVCPHCGSWFANDWPAVKQDLVESGQLRMIFRPLPSQPSQLSVTGFLMAECAGEENYMVVIEDQFERQDRILEAAKTGNGAAIKTEYDAIASAAGMTTPDEIAACLSNEAHLASIRTSSERAAAAGVSGIPSFIFDGVLMNGAHDTNAIKGWVEGRSSVRR